MRAVKTPKDLVMLCEVIAQGYERRKKAYESKRLDIIYSMGGGIVEFAGRGGGRGGGHSDKTASKSERLEALENSLDVQFMRAVEQSLSMTGTDVPSNLCKRLRKAILLNCESGREYPYDMLNVDEFSRRDFYRRRKRFILGIGAALQLTDG